jgi:hypothetical protein
VATAVVVDDYLAVPEERRKGASPYTFCVVTCMRQIRWWADKNAVTEPIAYILEDGAGFAGEIQQKRKELESDPETGKTFRYETLLNFRTF